ncbi:MAG TPA: glutamine-hydrolyzing carbamoyl-phosphate synthase small subunit [Acidimicrobiales bacterium]|nr:glutamine-hydrolyzing carbamoyl-phosphate synthase small subunit [Acidimicrobiales bacterium]
MSSAVRESLLVLADGTTFEGELIGAEPPAGGVATGEVVFNTTLTGYQEVLSDPSYAGQIVTFTAVHIGNYGVTAHDDESRRPFCSGVVVRDLARRRSNWRSSGDLDAYLRRHGVPGIAGIDTRRLTRHIRRAGALPGSFGDADEATLKAAAAAEPGTDGRDLVATVTCAEPYTVPATDLGPPGRDTPRRRIVAYDYGIKRTILRHLARLGEVTVVPAATPAAEVLAREPDGVFLSNGPGDPAAVTYAVDAIDQLVGEVPVFGICLGHQLLATALGGTTHKLPFGHHGGNHPVRRLATGRVEITSQNHNYAVVEGAMGADVEVTHVNLNDGVIEGIRSPRLRAFGVQYHPEAGPGPHDAAYLFAEFAVLMEGGGRPSGPTPTRRPVAASASGRHLVPEHPPAFGRRLPAASIAGRSTGKAGSSDAGGTDVSERSDRTRQHGPEARSAWLAAEPPAAAERRAVPPGPPSQGSRTVRQGGL